MERKTVLITGASRGIGAACARLFAKKGYAVAVNYASSEEKALTLVRELRQQGGVALAIRADVGNADQAGEMIRQVLQEWGTLDVLVCNAGVGQQSLFGNTAYPQWRRVFQVNVDGVYHCCQAVLPHFISRKMGRIVTLSSMWGQVGASCEVAYSASKAAVIGMTRALAKELGPSGITVNCVAPGVIETEMNGRLSPEDLEALREETPLERLGRPEDVARTVYFLASEEGGFFTGQVLSPNGGFVMV